MATFDDLGRLIAFVYAAHRDFSRTPGNAFRKFDGATPYATHPLWCAMAALAEPSISTSIRVLDAQTLLIHDLLDDTTVELPGWLGDDVLEALVDMSFADRDTEMREIWKRSAATRRRKLFDKTHNYHTLLGARNPAYDDYVLRLVDEVEAENGSLNIVKIARAIVTPGGR